MVYMKRIISMMTAAVALSACSLQPSNQPVEQNMDKMDKVEVVTDLMMSRRSIRAYKEEAVSRKTLNEILRCGINAPNGRNLQSYEIRIVDSPELIKAMTEAVVKDMPEVAKRPGFKNIFVNAPGVIFIAYDTRYDFAQVDCGLLGENIILAAWARGIGTCCLGSSARFLLQSPSAKPYLDRLNFSEGFELLYCIGYGYPDETPEAKPRKESMIQFID